MPRDEATLWFYIGQIRYRVLLRSLAKGTDQARDSEVFSALSDQVGVPINRYAFGDLPALTKIIGRNALRRVPAFKRWPGLSFKWLLIADAGPIGRSLRY